MSLHNFTTTYTLSEEGCLGGVTYMCYTVALIRHKFHQACLLNFAIRFYNRLSWEEVKRICHAKSKERFCVEIVQNPV